MSFLNYSYILQEGVVKFHNRAWPCCLSERGQNVSAMPPTFITVVTPLVFGLNPSVVLLPNCGKK